MPSVTQRYIRNSRNAGNPQDVAIWSIWAHPSDMTFCRGMFDHSGRFAYPQMRTGKTLMFPFYCREIGSRRILNAPSIFGSMTLHSFPLGVCP